MGRQPPQCEKISAINKNKNLYLQPTVLSRLSIIAALSLHLNKTRLKPSIWLVPFGECVSFLVNML